MEWTEESISRLRSLWHEGLSTAEIGRRMQISKNAVVGKAHRLTLSPRPSPIRKNSERRDQGAAPPRPVAAGREPVAESELPRPQPPATPEIQIQAVHPASAPLAAPDATPPRRPLAVVAATVPAEPDEPAAAEPSAPLRPVAAPPRRRGLTCCWPLGEPGTREFHFCGGDPIAGKPYCAEHAALAYVRIRDRRDSVA